MSQSARSSAVKFPLMSRVAPLIHDATLLGAMRSRRRTSFITAVLGVALVCWGAGRLGSRAAAAASQPYRPCPSDGEPCRILPLGDSLTSGIGYEGSYRVALFALAHAAGKSITFTGSLQNGADACGWRCVSQASRGAQRLEDRRHHGDVPRPALKTVPHIVLLHVGTNDVYAQESREQMVRRAELLIDRLEQALPRALIAVAQIVPQTDPALRDRSAQYNAELTRRVQERRTRGEHLLVVDQFSGFPLTLLSDGVHPTQVGYEHMASAWYAAIAPYLP